MRRKILLALAALILLAGAVFWWLSRPLPILNVVTWPGTYGRAQAAAQMQAYGAAKRVDVRIQQWAANGTLDELKRAIEAHRAGDVVDLELPVAVAACKAGLLETIDPATLPAGDDGTAAGRDFYKGMVSPCFVASAVYAQMIICQPCKYQNVGDLRGLFDLLGSKSDEIALPHSAKPLLEMALLADGAEPRDVYALLSTDAGVARAFAKLDSIKKSIVRETLPKPLLGRDVLFAMVLTADARAKDIPSLLLPQFYEADVLAVPKGTRKKDLAMDYIRFATSSAPLANMVKFAPYMPPRRSSLPLVEKLPASPPRDFVAAQKGMMEKSFAIDDAFWAEHGAVLEQRFRAWADTP